MVRICYILNKEYKDSGYDILTNALGDSEFTFTEWSSISVKF
jgi:hypothetical protein